MHILLSKTPSQVSTIKPEVTVDQESNPPKIMVEVNGASSTANLPVSGGGPFSNYEEINLDNIPTDFSDGDQLLIIFRKIVTSFSEPYMNYTPVGYLIHIVLSNETQNPNFPIGAYNPTPTRNTFGESSGTCILTISGVSLWNDTSRGMFTLNFMGNNLPTYVTRTNIKDIILEMWRKKATN